MKVPLIGPFNFARERVNLQRVWSVSGSSPRYVDRHDRPILDFSDSKTTFARLIRQKYWIFQFSNKIA